MPNAWLNHVRQLRKNNKNMSYKQLLSHAKNSYGGGDNPPAQSSSLQSAMKTLGMSKGGGADNPPAQSSSLQSAMKTLGMSKGGGVTGFESRSSLTRSASSVGGRRSRSRKTRRRRR